MREFKGSFWCFRVRAGISSLVFELLRVFSRVFVGSMVQKRPGLPLWVFLFLCRASILREWSGFLRERLAGACERLLRGFL